MNSLTATLFLGFVVGTVLAGIIQQCPQKNYKTDFNMTLFEGEWNEILRIPNILEQGYSCMLDEYSTSPSGITRVHSHAYNSSKAAYVILDGTASVSEPGRFDITYSGDTIMKSRDRNTMAKCPLHISEDAITSKIKSIFTTSKWGEPATTTVWSSSYWVLGTDYNRYVVLWGCLVEDNGVIRPLSWVSSRHKALDEDSMQEVNEILRHNGLDRSQYEDVAQTNCPSMSTMMPTTMSNSKR